MRLCFISPTHFLVNRGAEYSTHLQATGLSKLGVNCLVICNGESIQPLIYSYKSYGQKVSSYEFDESRNVFTKIINRFYLTKPNLSSILLLLKSRKEIKDFKPDFIVLNSAPLLLLSKIMFPNFKTLSFGHAGVGFHTFDILRLKPDLFISLTPDLLEYKKRVHGCTQLVYIPNGIDVDFFKPIKKLKKEIRDLVPKNKKIILCAAALIPYKRVGNLISAVSILEDCFLIIAGDGPLKIDLNAQAIKLLGKNNYLIDTFKKEDMPQLYSLADVFVLPSEEKEAFGNVIIEALACNTPVVVNKDSIRKEIVGTKAGMLVDCSKPTEIRKGVLEVFKKDYNDNPKEQAEKFDYINISKVLNMEFKKLLNDE